MVDRKNSEQAVDRDLPSRPTFDFFKEAEAEILLITCWFQRSKRCQQNSLTPGPVINSLFSLLPLERKKRGEERTAVMSEVLGIACLRI